MGVYENSSCRVDKPMRDWEELKKVFIGWIYAKGEDNSPLVAIDAAALAFYEKYGCESYLSTLAKKQKLLAK